MKYGYARVSSKAQDHAAQIEALKAVGCERIFSEKVLSPSPRHTPAHGTEAEGPLRALGAGVIRTLV
ncbi:MAG TPA: recombinase family protein [Pirellulales bacterium]